MLKEQRETACMTGRVVHHSLRHPLFLKILAASFIVLRLE